jgi:DNA-binding response OmpR family regulator
MRVLIAEDDPISRRLLEATLRKWGYDLVVACDGDEAWRALDGPAPPDLAILDWMMPGMDGVEVCRRLRSLRDRPPVYIILLTAKGGREDIVEGLQAGADDYITKPFDRDELRARVQVGIRVVDLQRSLADRVRDLEDALSRVKQLQGLLPICSYCKKIRDDQNYWTQVENYVTERSEARFSHSICPSCYDAYVKPDLQALGPQSRPQDPPATVSDAGSPARRTGKAGPA